MATDFSSVFSGETAKPVRSTFLTVLCVLTFAGSILFLFSGIRSYVTAEATSTELKKQQEKMKKDVNASDTTSQPNKGKDFAIKIADSMAGFSDVGKIKQGAIISIVSNLLTLLGAILMWRLNRTGFYIYVAGSLAGIAAPFIIYGGSNLLANLGSAFWGFFGLVFIIMYAFNLKDMKPANATVV